MKKINTNRKELAVQPADKFDTVKFFRKVKKKIAEKTNGMSFEEFKTYLDSRKLKSVRK